MANAAITSPFYSYAVNPQGYPAFFNYTPAFTGFSVGPTVNRAVFWVVGGICHVQVNLSAGTSNSGTMTGTLPVATLDVNGVGQAWFTNATDNGTLLTAPAAIRLRRNSVTVDIYKDSSMGGNAWAGAGSTGPAYMNGCYQI